MVVLSRESQHANTYITAAGADKPAEEAKPAEDKPAETKPEETAEGAKTEETPAPAESAAAPAAEPAKGSCSMQYRQEY